MLSIAQLEMFKYNLNYPHMNVYENMAFGLKLSKTPKSEIDRRINEAAKILEIEELLDRKPKDMSGGQRQRVALGRAVFVIHRYFYLMNHFLILMQNYEFKSELK